MEHKHNQYGHLQRKGRSDETCKITQNPGQMYLHQMPGCKNRRARIFIMSPHVPSFLHHDLLPADFTESQWWSLKTAFILESINLIIVGNKNLQLSGFSFQRIRNPLKTQEENQIMRILYVIFTEAKFGSHNQKKFQQQLYWDLRTRFVYRIHF